jgi:SAM-dependent methyltransferase
MLLESLRPLKNMALLDVACGPGTVAGLAHARIGPHGRVVGTDSSVAMLEFARTSNPEIEYIEADAEHLPFGDRAFDIVTCQQGLQFFVDSSAAVAEMYRVLRPGGHVGIAVWSSIDECEAFEILCYALRAGACEDAAELMSAPFAYGESERLADDVRRAGFVAADVSIARLPLVFEGGVAQAVGSIYSTPACVTFEGCTAAQRKAYELTATTRFKEHLIGQVVHTMMTSRIVSAARPN